MPANAINLIAVIRWKQELGLVAFMDFDKPAIASESHSAADVSSQEFEASDLETTSSSSLASTVSDFTELYLPLLISTDEGIIIESLAYDEKTSINDLIVYIADAIGEKPINIKLMGSNKIILPYTKKSDKSKLLINYPEVNLADGLFLLNSESDKQLAAKLAAYKAIDQEFENEFAQRERLHELISTAKYNWDLL